MMSDVWEEWAEFYLLANGWKRVKYASFLEWTRGDKCYYYTLPRAVMEQQAEDRIHAREEQR